MWAQEVFGGALKLLSNTLHLSSASSLSPHQYVSYMFKYLLLFI
jgi:hypothetical protein